MPEMGIRILVRCTYLVEFLGCVFNINSTGEALGLLLDIYMFAARTCCQRELLSGLSVV
jgi:hypothetical protein